MNPRVLIATNEPVLAKGLEAVLTAGGLDVVDVCKDIFEVFGSLHRSPPDVAILDNPILPSPEIIQDLRRIAPRCKFVLWPRLTSGQQPKRLVEAIHTIAHFSEPEAPPSALVDFACSATERELIALVGYGLSNEEIASAIRVDASTVTKLVKNVSDKLGAEDRYELAMYGLSTLNNPHRQEERL
jgi:DNA-binding NarL/FixJ family response regulator